MKVRAVDVGDEVHLNSTVGKGLKGLYGHAGPKVAASNANVYDVLKGLARGAAHSPFSNGICKVEHALAFAHNPWAQVLAVDH